MLVKAKKSCLVATLLAINIIWRKVNGDNNKSYKQNGSANCDYNYYFNGNYCTECPTGTFGINCSTKCSPSTYGKLCSQKCVCSNSSCHHVFGCSVISTVLARRTTMVETFTGTINTTPDIKAEIYIDKKDIRATTGYVFISEHFEKILVILAGTVSSLILLLLIAREIYKLFRMSETCSNYQFTKVGPVINNTSDETTEFLDNSHEHRDI